MSESRAYLFSRHRQFDVVNSKLNVMLDDRSHLIRSVRECCYSCHQFALSPRHFLAIGQITGSRYIARIDGISDGNVKTFFRRGGTKTPEREVNSMQRIPFRNVERLTSYTPNQDSIERSELSTVCALRPLVHPDGPGRLHSRKDGYEHHPSPA